MINNLSIFQKKILRMPTPSIKQIFEHLRRVDHISENFIKI